MPTDNEITALWYSDPVRQRPIEFARALLAAPEAAVAIELGFGRVEVAEGTFEGKLALIFGRDGTGEIGTPTQSNREHQPGETLAVVTFENVASLDVVTDKLATIRSKLDPTTSQAGQPQPIETAPKDGTMVQLLVPTTYGKWSKELWLPGSWFCSMWVSFNADEAVTQVHPTHWQPAGAGRAARDALDAVRESDKQLMRFYSADTRDALIDAMDRHITRLQSKLPPLRDEFPRTPREG